MRALFFGTPAIAVPALKALAGGAEVAGVVCQPDRPAGRGLELKAPAVKVAALELGLEVLQPAKIRTPEFAEWVRGRAADVALVMAYGRILPPAVLEGPRRGCMNLHASLLPRYRGAAPITWAIVRGETETGISLMQMDEGCDTGPVFTRHAIAIDEDMNAEELAAALAELAADVVHADLVRAVSGEIAAEPQDAAGATLAPLLKKEDGLVPWEQPAKAVHDHVRGMTPWPGASTRTAGKLLKILESRVARARGEFAPPGTIITAEKDALTIACGTGAVHLLRAQVEGRKPLTARELVTGRVLCEGQVLGSAATP